MSQLFCPNCGSQIISNQRFCDRCGTDLSNVINQSQPATGNQYNQPPTSENSSYFTTAGSNVPPKPKDPNPSEKSGVVALVLLIFVGYLGVHQFYVGKIGMGILYLCTGGLFGIGIIIDFIKILTGDFTDEFGKHLNLDN